MTRPVFPALAAFLLLAATLRARSAGGDEPPGSAGDAARLALATERVVVFKDGYALFVKAGRATADASGRVFTEEVPGGTVLGCFWALGEDRRVLGLRAGWEETRETRTREAPCLGVLDLLRANVGQVVTLGLTREHAADVTGRVLEVLDEEPRPEEPPVPGAPPPPRPTAPWGRSVRPVPVAGGSHVVVAQGERGRIVLPVAEVRTVSGESLSTRIRRREEVVTRTKRLSVELGKDAAGKPATVRLLYFAEGVRWIPSYRVEGDLVKDARVALQGEVLNEAEPIVDAALDLVVGVPSFRFKDVASPLTLEEAMRSALRNAAPMLAQQMASNRLSNTFQNEADFGEAGGRSGAFEAAPELAREAHQDLFVYGLGKASLPKGSRAAFPLWQSTVPVRHLYTMDLHVVRDYRSGDWAVRSARSEALLGSVPRPDRTGTNLVWHELELTNASDVPWTTGAALLLQGDLPLGQDVLPYTSTGTASRLPVTVAVDLAGKWEEKEVERQPNALSWSQWTYSLVVKQGTATVSNKRKEPSLVRVSLALGGKASQPSPDAKVTLNDLRSDDWSDSPSPVNNHSDVVWEATLAAGETRTFTVRFSFYVR
jgi:hypothetical protein